MFFGWILPHGQEAIFSYQCLQHNPSSIKSTPLQEKKQQTKYVNEGASLYIIWSDWNLKVDFSFKVKKLFREILPLLQQNRLR